MWIVLFIICVLTQDLFSLNYKSVFQSSVVDKTINESAIYAALAVDGDVFTYTQTEDGVNNYWKINFANKIDVSCFTWTSREGSYKISVVSSYADSENLCDSFKLEGKSQTHSVTRCCRRQLEGGSIVITRTDSGPLRLYEFDLKDCPSGGFGVSCQKCRGCTTCDAANGTCLLCPPFKYGQTCELECPDNCSSCDIKNGKCQLCARCAGECDKETGFCKICKPGFFQPPYCYRCKDSIRHCFQCNSAQICDKCETGYHGDECKEVSVTKKSNCTLEDTLMCSAIGENNKHGDNHFTNGFELTTRDKPERTEDMYEAVENDVGIDETAKVSTKNSEPVIIYIMTVLLGVTALGLLLVLVAIKRTSKCIGFNQPEVICDGEEQTHVFHMQQNSFGDKANSIFLEEITDTNIIQDEAHRIDVEYTNTTSHRISVNTFIDHHCIRRENNIFEEDEFSNLPTGLLELHTEALKKENIYKNRYRYVYPYDFCRVPLGTCGTPGENDYINACYIEDNQGKYSYIAAQGPFTPLTLIDFWRMVWQENCSRIVMLTNLFEGDNMKCLKYWPEEQIEFSYFTVRLESEDIHEMYTIRYLVVQQNNELKKISQFHFTGWPDCGVPSNASSLLCFRDLVKNDRHEADSPIIVHCSAGIGRTGTFIALDYLLEEGSTMESVDIINCVSKLRHQRAHSIQTKEQYIFLYDALAQGLKNARFLDKI